MKRLTCNYLGLLTNADHYGVMRHIVDYMEDNVNSLGDCEPYNAAFDVLMNAHNAEVAAYLQIRKDYKTEQLRQKHKDMLGFMSALRYTVYGNTRLPEGQGNKDTAMRLYDIINSFKLNGNEGYESSTAKVENIVEEFNKHDEWLTDLGIKTLVTKVGASCNIVRQMIKERIQFEADKVKGLLKVCRQNTDTAISNVFDVINAVNTLTPNAELTKNIDFLIALEDRVRQYNLGKKKSGASDDEDGIIESITGGSDTTTVTPENNSGGSGTGSISQNGTSGQSEGNSNNQNHPSDNFYGDMN